MLAPESLSTTIERSGRGSSGAWGLSWMSRSSERVVDHEPDPAGHLLGELVIAKPPGSRSAQ